MALPKKVIIRESAPRDGWQNWKTQIPTEKKLEYIKKMIDLGTRTMEVTSYVSPKWVPQLADADTVTTEVLSYCKGKECLPTALTLNGRGVERAIGLGMNNVCFVISASNEHNKRNSNKSTLECLADFEKMCEAYQDRGLNVMLAVACSFGSPFGETIQADEVKRICEVALRHGIREVGLADSAGVSTPDNTQRMLDEILPYVGAENVSMHLHDTRGMGLANVYVGLLNGITTFDAALGGMGGCPYIPGAKGNIATEDVVNMCQAMGIDTGYDLEKLTALSVEMTTDLGAPIVSSMASLYVKQHTDICKD